MAERKNIEDLYLTNNTIRTYYALDEAMFKAHREDRNEFAESTARSLLEHDDLPLLIRARTCMILGCSIEPDFLEMAEEAVRIAELGFSRCNDPGETEKQLVADCKTVLREAKEAWEAHNKEDEDEGAEDELVWKAASEDDSTPSVAGGRQINEEK